MEEIKQLIQTGQLQEAISHCQTILKKQPQDTDIRSAYIELLCINGDLDKADNQINLLINQAPQTAVGGKNVQQLIRAQQARIDFYQGAATAEVFSAPDAELAAIVALQLAKNEQDQTGILKQCQALEQARFLVNPSLPRDLDDTLAGYLEVFGTNGKFYLVKIAEINLLQWQPASSILEQVWRRVHIDINNGPSGDAFIPMTYIDSCTEAEKLGRETDWMALNDAEDEALIMYQGIGQKMLLVGEAAQPLASLAIDVEASEMTAETV